VYVHSNKLSARSYDETALLYRCGAGGDAVVQKEKPTASAAAVLEQRQKAKGSLKRAEEMLGPKAGGDRGAPPPMITKAAETKKKELVGDAEVKQIVKERLQAESAKEKKKAAGAGGGKLARMLKELELEGK
jgi:hypothetical protein